MTYIYLHNNILVFIKTLITFIFSFHSGRRFWAGLIAQPWPHSSLSTALLMLFVTVTNFKSILLLEKYLLLIPYNLFLNYFDT